MVGMTIPQPRLTQTIEALSSAQRRSLCRRLQCNADELADSLADPEAIQGRVLRLSDEERDTFASLLAAEPVLFFDEHIERLVADGLAFTTSRSPQLPAVVPFEVRCALLTTLSWHASTLAACIWENDETDLDEIASLHDLLPPMDEDEIDATLAFSNTLVDPDHLGRLLESLPPTARNLLTWACEWSMPFSADELREASSRLNSRYQDGTAADRVLIRLGLIQHIPGTDTLVVPVDLRGGVVPLLDAHLCDRAFEHWDALRSHSLPGFNDLLPRGLYADPLSACRAGALAISSPEPLDRLENAEAIELLQTLHLLHDDQLSHYLPALLDSSCCEAFTRRALRSWLSLIGDDVTFGLLRAFSIDGQAILEHLTDAVDDEPTNGLTNWSELLFTFRAQILIGLAVLPPGYWHRKEHLAGWIVAAFRRLLWLTGRAWTNAADLPDDAIPPMSIDIGADRRPAVEQQLNLLFDRLLVPLGAVMRDPSGDLFMVNIEALRAIADGDVNASPALASTDRLVGDDMGLWLPMPIDPGIRVNGVADLATLNDTTIVISEDCHFHDLSRLARIARVRRTGSGWVATLHPGSSSALKSADERLEMAQWLACRTQNELPEPWLTALRLPHDQDALDAPESNPELRRVRQLMVALERSQGLPPGQLLEEMRGWGQAARDFLRGRFEDWTDARTWPSDPMSICALLLGELGDVDATATLLRAFAYTDDMFVESAVSVALSRLGPSAVEGLFALFQNEAAEMEKRFLAATTLTAIAVLHPHTHHAIVPSLIELIEVGDLDPGTITPLAVTLADTGHPEVEALFHRLKERGLWTDGYMPFDEALWVVNHSPMFWGAHGWSDPLLDLFAASPNYTSPAIK